MYKQFPNVAPTTLFTRYANRFTYPKYDFEIS